MLRSSPLALLLGASLALPAGVASAAITFDGADIPTEAANNGLTQLAVQDTPTQFGNSSGADQTSPGGSELNALWASLDSTTLTLAITGNLEANFNKMWVFLDGVAGGENVLAGDNADGGFGEINSLAGLTFANGATMDHGLRLEIGSGFHGINVFDLIDNTGSTAISGGGPGDLPLVGATGGGLTVGWDNANPDGVTDTDASTALTATTGWEIAIDLATIFGETPSAVGITTFISNGGGDFVSNQVLPGIGGGGNIGGPSGATVGVVVIPEPATLGLMVLGGTLMLSRRRGA